MNSRLRSMADRAITRAKRAWYGERGEPIPYGAHLLRYVPGTRPPRSKYLESGDATTRNDLRQIEFLLANVAAGDLAFDVGAHAGQYAVLLGSLVGSGGSVYSFEPDEIARSFLHKNIALNQFRDRVTVEPIALSDQNGSHVFFSLGGNSMSSLVRAGLGTAAQSEAVSESIIPTIRLDDFVAERGLPFPQWVKIDAEGAEVLILKGGPATLRSARGILCELHPYAWAEFGSSFEQLLAVVQESGRKMRYLDPDLKVANGPAYGTVMIT